ncbi:MAG: hypothetical protein AB8B89_04175 [Gammaproteobacteria bacterium]
MSKQGAFCKSNKCQYGFSYVEIILATLLISITLIPALESMQTAQLGSSVHQSLLTEHYHLRAKLEEVLSQSFNSLQAASLAAGSSNVASSYSDAGGSSSRRLVYLSLYDIDNADNDDDPFTGVDDDLIWVQVMIEHSSQKIQTLVGR